MRLIDADKLRVYVTIENNGINDTRKIVDMKLTGTETVEAIPIEWIKLQIDQMLNEIEHYEIAGVNCSHKGVETLEALLEEWEGENGRS